MSEVTQVEAGHDHGEHPAFLHHHFDTPRQQFESDKFGMWLFLATEVLLFGGLFCAYAVYRSNHPEIFIYAHHFLNKTLGATNTIVLLISSWTMAMAVRATQLSRKRDAILFLAATVLCAFGFMGIKAIEYTNKWREGLLWGTHYGIKHEGGAEDAAEAAPAAPSAVPAPVVAAPAASTAVAAPAPVPGAPVIPEHSKIAIAPLPPAGLAGNAAAELGGHISEQMEPKNVRTFFAVYFVMTGLHGVHVLAGIIVICIMIGLTAKNKFNAEYFTPVELTGLYWHIVDLIWIFLFPLLYLIH